MALVQLASAAMESFGPYFIKIMVDAFQTVENKADIWFAFGWALPCFVIFFLILQPVLSRMVTSWMAEIRMPFMSMIRRQLSLYVYTHHYKYFQNEFAGRLSSKVLETPHAIIQIVFNTIMSFGFVSMTFIVALVLFSIVHWTFTVATLVWFGVYMILCHYYVPKIVSISAEMYDDLSKVRGTYVDSLSNISSVFLFGRRKYEDKLLTASLENSSSSGIEVWHMMNRMYIALEVVSVGFIAVVFYLCVTQWQAGTLTLGDVAMVLPMMLRLMQMSWWVSEMLVGMFENIGQVKEGMEALFSRPTDPEDKMDKSIRIYEGDIRLKNVLFQYDEQPVFDGLDLHIPAGQKVGLVGRSGAGKTTLTQILMRLFDVQGGDILMDGQSVYDYSRVSLREGVAIIPQNTDMFHRSLMDNIRYGRLDATDAEVVEAAKKAYAHEFIDKLPEGYDTLVGERGVKLSGGQRQRIAIARAILKDAPILILDEATSALDSESEKAIQDSLKELMQGKTVIAIAHRLSTIAHMDRLLVMEQGTIVEDGSHKELLEKKGTYASLWSMQSGGFLGE